MSKIWERDTMKRYDLLSIRCRLCDWQWDTTPEEKSNELVCEECGCADLVIEEKMLHMIHPSTT